jgi:hypothetical protein
VATSLFDDAMRGAEYPGAIAAELPNLKIVRLGKFQVMPENCRKFSLYAGQEFH